MSACGLISQGIVFDCDNPLTPGVDDRLLLFNRSELSGVSFDVTDTFIITDITLTGGSVAYAFGGNRQSNNPQYSLVPQTATVGYDHLVQFLGFDISAASKDNLVKLALGEVVAIVENRNAPGNGDNFFEVYGLDQGLEVSEMIRIPSDNETIGAFNITVKTTDDGGKEPYMPRTWFDTDYATTKALVDALLTP